MKQTTVPEKFYFPFEWHAEWMMCEHNRIWWTVCEWLANAKCERSINESAVTGDCKMSDIFGKPNEFSFALNFLYFLGISEQQFLSINVQSFF